MNFIEFFQCETVNWMTPIVFGCYLISLVIPRLERLLIYLLLIGSTLAHWHYGTIVVSFFFYFLLSGCLNTVQNSVTF